MRRCGPSRLSGPLRVIKLRRWAHSESRADRSPSNRSLLCLFVCLFARLLLCAHNAPSPRRKRLEVSALCRSRARAALVGAPRRAAGASAGTDEPATRPRPMLHAPTNAAHGAIPRMTLATARGLRLHINGSNKTASCFRIIKRVYLPTAQPAGPGGCKLWAHGAAVRATMARRMPHGAAARAGARSAPRRCIGPTCRVHWPRRRSRARLHAASWRECTASSPRDIAL
jgi:hypothetical protein